MSDPRATFFLSTKNGMRSSTSPFGAPQQEKKGLFTCRMTQRMRLVWPILMSSYIFCRPIGSGQSIHLALWSGLTSANAARAIRIFIYCSTFFMGVNTSLLRDRCDSPATHTARVFSDEMEKGKLVIFTPTASPRKLRTRYVKWNPRQEDQAK